MGAGASVQSVDMDTLKLVSCKKRQRLAADPNRVTPDIDPKSCKEGSISCGKDNRIFVIKSGTWSEMNGLSEESKKAICERLNSGKKKSTKRKTNLGDAGDDQLLDLSKSRKTSLGDAGDVPMISLGSMKKKACSVDAKLNANPKRRAPPIQPKTCKEGSVAMGKDGKPYVIKSGRWITAEKSLTAKQKELVKERLAQKMSGTRKAMEKVKSKAPKTPKRGKPKGSKKKAASKKSAKRATTPKRPRVKKM
jgi:hypothetical protein